jgi:hypothetical protein
MVTSRTVEEVMSLLKKDLIKTVEEDYEKVTPATTAMLTLEQRVPSITHPRNSCLCNPILGSSSQWNPVIDGIHRRIQ